MCLSVLGRNDYNVQKLLLFFFLNQRLIKLIGLIRPIYCQEFCFVGSVPSREISSSCYLVHNCSSIHVPIQLHTRCSLLLRYLCFSSCQTYSECTVIRGLLLKVVLDSLPLSDKRLTSFPVLTTYNGCDWIELPICRIRKDC